MSRQVGRAAWLGLAWLGAMPVWGAAAAPDDATVMALHCEPVYMPAREAWLRTVELVGRGGQLSEVRIDGQRVYTFSVRGTVVLTSQDNERIQIDMAQRQWTSDFRGLASGQGRCELVGSP